jgi:O-Antigen ligase
MMRDSLLALGVLLSLSTQLRLGADAPLGPGEVCLVAWLALAVSAQAGRRGLTTNKALTRVIAFWLIIFVAASIGTFVGFATELFFDTAHMIHDVVAYMLLLALGCMMAIELADARRRRWATWIVVVLGAGSLTLQVAGAHGWIRLPMDAIIEPWFYDRLRGWSKDPNQLGFLAASLTLLSLHLAGTATKRFGTVAAVACAAHAFSVGLLTKSDSYILCILTGGPVFLAIKFSVWLRTFESGLTFRGSTASIILLASPMFVLAAVPFAPAAIERAEAQSEAVYDEDGQGDARLHLWKEAIEKGMDAAMLGLGPGPHLTSKAWKRPPPDKFEAHNTPLDLFTQGGLFAVLALAWIYASTLLATIKAKLPSLAALMCGFAVFSMFHFIVRHPIFWFGIVLCLLEAASFSRLAVASGQTKAVRP